MSTIEQREMVTFFGPIKISFRTYYWDLNSVGGEIVLEGSFRCNFGHFSPRQFRNVPILTLSVSEEKFLDGDVTEYYCNEKFFHFLPYLKPVKSFREFLIEQISKYLSENEEKAKFAVLIPAVRYYLKELAEFDEKKSLVRQAKTAVNRLDAKRPHEKSRALRVLDALGVQPQTRRPFIWLPND